MVNNERQPLSEGFSSPEMLDEPHEECGVFVIVSPNSVTNRLLAGTVALENRGYHAAGAYVFNGKKFVGHKAKGPASEVLTDEVAQEINMRAPNATTGIGHTRYSTDSGEGYLPWIDDDFGCVHNGNVQNAVLVAMDNGISFNAHVTDSVAMGMSINQARKECGDLVIALQQEAPKFQGAFSMGFVEGNKIVGMRDPNGIRPLSIGKLPDGGYTIASETTAFDKVGAEWLRDVEAGEIVVIDGDNLEAGIQSYSLTQDVSPEFCAMELAYFEQPTSEVGPAENRIPIWDLRRLLGKQMAAEHPVDNPDNYLVIGVPASGLPSAKQYANELGIAFRDDIITKIQKTRSFQGESREEREIVTDNKLAIDAEALLEALWDEKTQKFKELIVVDDSIIRGNVIRRLKKRLDTIADLRVTVISAFPMVKSGCHLGTASKTEDLLTYGRDLEEMHEFTGVDSLLYISSEGFDNVVAPFVGKVCKGCVKLEYPVEPLPEEEQIDLMELLAAVA